MTIEGNIITLEKLELMNIIAKGVQIGIMEYNKTDSASQSRYISQAKAWRKYGRRNVEMWRKAGLIKRYQDGPGKRYRYDLVELETAASTSNRVAFYSLNNKTA